jgi:hypothetical protein
LEGKRLMANPNTRNELRSIEELRERRSRTAGSIDRMYSLKMAVPEAAQQQYGDMYDFRWFNDTGIRIHTMTEIDTWQKVPGVPPLTVGTDDEKNPIKAFLCMKPKEFVREDRAAKARALTEMEQGIVRGNTDQADLKDVSYVPKGQSNRIGRVQAPPA